MANLFAMRAGGAKEYDLVKKFKNALANCTKLLSLMLKPTVLILSPCFYVFIVIHVCDNYYNVQNIAKSEFLG